MNATRRHRIILAVIFLSITIGIAQGLPDAIQSIADVLGLH